MSVRTELNTDDFDLFVVYDANNDGTFTNAEIVGASAGGTRERVRRARAPRRTATTRSGSRAGSVAGTPTLKLTIDAIQGN